MAIGTRPFCGFHDLDGARQGLADLAGHAVAFRTRHEVGLVQDHEVGAQQLVLVYFLERIVVVERGVVRRAAARCVAGSSAKRPAATAAPSTTATTPSTVTRERISGQLKAFTSGLGNARPDVSMTMCSGGAAGRAAPSAPARNRRQRCSRCSRWRARRCSPRGSSRCRSLQDLAVDAEIAELVDDDARAGGRRRSRARAGSASSCRRRGSR